MELARHRRLCGRKSITLFQKQFSELQSGSPESRALMQPWDLGKFQAQGPVPPPESFKKNKEMEYLQISISHCDLCLTGDNWFSNEMPHVVICC